MGSISAPWKWDTEVPAISFSLDGTTAVRARGPAGRGWVTVATGQVEHVEPTRLLLGNGISLRLRLPDAIDLSKLQGTWVHCTLHEEPSRDGPTAQTLVLGDARERTLLIARSGSAGQVHTLGRSRIHTVLSQRENGPIAFGTDRIQFVVHVRQHVRICDGSNQFVMHFIDRSASDRVAYTVVERRLWVTGRR